MRKRTKNLNCECCVCLRVVALKKKQFLHFLNCWSIPSKNGLIGQKRNLFLSTGWTFLPSPLFLDIPSENFEPQSRFPIDQANI